MVTRYHDVSQTHPIAALPHPFSMSRDEPESAACHKMNSALEAFLDDLIDW